jgi:hypothetical protein
MVAHKKDPAINCGSLTFYVKIVAPEISNISGLPNRHQCVW